MDQVSRHDLQPADLNRIAELDKVGVSVRHGYASREQVKSQRFDSRKIPNRTVGNVAYTVQCQTDGRVDFSNQSTQPRGVIDIFHQDDPGCGDSGYILPEIHAVIVASAGDGGTGGSDTPRNRVTQHGVEIREPATRYAGNKSFIPEP